ncbi:hypothetical protein MTR67_030858 [Solanum verrucosum]|uniref:Uncharacterized protein n=1 Tax=Solanum verrucosum TaxID=315347 RepID=A0AAF0ZF79_SOLVR|nr:hypothetical protein MTR67_030858 [Solanum verrucosum]
MGERNPVVKSHIPGDEIHEEILLFQLGNISWLVNVLDGTDPDAVAKSLHKFVNYGKRNKESVAEFLVTLHCGLRSYGPKDNVEVPMKHLLYLKHRTPKFVASVEDFTDLYQNAARVVGKEEVKHIYKCIQRTSEYIFASMDGLVEIPILKFQLFGRVTPIQDGSETRKIIEYGNTPTLPYRDIKKPYQIKESHKGIQSALLSEPITRKIKWPIEGWKEVRQRVGDNLRMMVDHPTLLGQKGNGLPKLGNIPWLVNVLDGNDPDAVAKSLHKFVNYGTKNKDSVSELLVTLLVKVEDFTDWSQNAARAVGEAEL